MRLYLRGRQEGKTTELIKMAAKDDLQIISFSRQQAMHTAFLAKRLGYDIKHPLSIQEVHFPIGGSEGLKTGVYDTEHILLDDVELILMHIFGNNAIEGMSISNGGVVNLMKGKDDGRTS